MYVFTLNVFSCSAQIMSHSSDQNIVILSLSYIPSYVDVHSGYREKSADLQGKLKLHVQFCNRVSRLQRPAMKISMHLIFCMHAVWLKTHPCLKGNLREDWARGAPHSLAVFTHAV